jgi:protoheme IX farnesyltransferase
MNAASLSAMRERGRFGLFFDLFKLRIGLVIGFTAVAGLAITPGPSLAPWRILALALAVTLASAAAGAFNQYVERDIDAKMGRTRNRAFVTGRLVAGPRWLATIVAIGIGGVLLAAIALNVATAAFTFAGAFTYGVVYTVWLKRRTWWNIVVGGLAGSFAVLAGAAAVAPGTLGPLPLAFAVVLFLWTPPHFWSLAIAFRDDYAAARVPMLPAVVGDARAARAVLASATMLVVATLVPAMLGMGLLYLAAAVAGGGYFLATGVRLVRAPNRRNALVNFHASLVQLTLLLVAAIADAAWNA